jgi:hypothetical protein
MEDVKRHSEIIATHAPPAEVPADREVLLESGRVR